MVTVTVRETYDLSTKAGKMTLIGIHTPTNNIISRLYPGFCEQYKMVRILHQNVRLACAQRLPVDPAGIGVNTEGLVSPEDMFNPILYKACSNQSLNNLEYRIRGLMDVGLTTNGESVAQSNENVTDFDDEFDIYYSLLSNTRGWKVAHPQAGLQMRKLVPLVFEKWYNEGVNVGSSNVVLTTPSGSTPYVGNMASDAIPMDTSLGGESGGNISNEITSSMRGRPHRMPAFNTKYLTLVRTTTGAIGDGVQNGMIAQDTPYGYPANAQAKMPQIPRIFTACIVAPPSRSTVLYYRMVVETVVQFYGIQSMDEIATFNNLNDREYFPVYWKDYNADSKMLTVSEDTVSATEGSTVKKIMES